MKNKECCEQMENVLSLGCEGESNPFRCLNSLIYYNEIFDEYGLIIHDGGESYIKIEYCPFCGKKLPESKRSLWFDLLEELGYENPLEDDIPLEYKTSLWWKNIHNNMS